MKLNLGCGSNKIPGYINIDSEINCKPDVCFDFVKKWLPYKNSSIEEVLLFHTIEHISKESHSKVLTDCSRILKPGGTIYISYPNFWECAIRWKENTGGLRKFWEATLYGRQLYDSDYHVCAMSPDELALMLFNCGFDDIKSVPELDEPYNTITTAVKTRAPLPHYEDLVAADLKNMKVRELCR